MRILFLCFLTVPIIEMLVLLEVGAFIGAFYTVLLVLLTAVIGVSLLKKQGLSTFIKANQKMQTGQMPVAEMGEGLMLAVAGALLLTPGFVTDAIGFILLTPGLRRSIAKTLFQKMLENAQQNSFYSQTTYQAKRSGPEVNPFSASARRSEEDLSGVIDGEFQDLSSDPLKSKLEAKTEKDR